MLDYGTQPDVLGPLTAAQRSIWAAQQLRPEVPYNFAAFLAIDHHVDAERLMRACEAAATRFGSPCTRVAVDGGEPVFMVDRSFPNTLHCRDFRGEDDPVTAARAWMNAEYRRPVDLGRDRLTEFALLRVADELCYFYLRTHHVVLDGFGANVLIRYVAAAYTAAESPDGKVVDFSEFALIRKADHSYQQSTRSRADAEYWSTVVQGGLDVTDLTGTPRLVAPRHPEVRELICEPGQGARDSARAALDVARIVAIMAVFLAKTTGLQQVSMSLPVSARTSAALKKCTGMVSNLVPLLIGVGDDDTIGAITDRVATSLIGALRHQQFRRWPDLVGGGSTRLDMNVEFGPVINILSFVEPFAFGPSEVVYNLLSIFPVQDIAVSIYPWLDGQAPRIQFTWNPDRYAADDIDRHISRLESLLSRLLSADASLPVREVSLLASDEWDLLVRLWSGAGVGA
ncbi:condensation domain-containing protein, partial [Mycobacterium sp. E2462]|uniref:condensation domain-containing protein n=1 Tax=Mycobacterium sp. E2462 TaxID=1834133 RepID=UPI001E57FB01